MIDFTAKDISEAFQVDMPKARAIVKVCKIYDKQGYVDSDRDTLQWLDKACGTFGLEHIDETSQSYPDICLEFSYLNAGDTYASTLVFDLDESKITLTSWGDAIEHLEHKQYDYLEGPRPAICPSCNHHSFYEDRGSSHRLEALKGDLQCPNCLEELHY